MNSHIIFHDHSLGYGVHIFHPEWCTKLRRNLSLYRRIEDALWPPARYAKPTV
jgi:hypothetical protein